MFVNECESLGTQETGSKSRPCGKERLATRETFFFFVVYISSNIMNMKLLIVFLMYVGSFPYYCPLLLMMCT